MSQLVTISSVTANTPVNIYYCDSTGSSCVYVATVSTFPYTFDVPDPYDLSDYRIKIDDTIGCEYYEMVYITPTPTPSITASSTVTPTVSPTQSSSPTVTPTNTATPTTTVSYTPTNTPTPTTTPVISYHLIGQNTFATSANTCSDTITSTNYYTYISQANSTPVAGAKVYETVLNGVLYTPYNGSGRWIKMLFGSNYYAVQINTSGDIVNYVLCP